MPRLFDDIIDFSIFASGAVTAAPAFNPSQLNPYVWYDDESPIYSDTAGTTLVTADNAAVRRIGDRSGNGYDATSSTPLTLKTSIYSKRCVQTGGISMTLGQPAGLIDSINNNNDFATFVFLKTSNTANFYLFGSDRTKLGFLGGVWGTVSDTIGPVAGGSQPFTFGQAGYSAATCVRRFVSGAAVDSNLENYPAPGTQVDITIFGATGTDVYNITGDHCAFLILPSCTPAQMLQLSDYYYNKFGVTNPRLSAPYQVVWEGNSFSAQQGLTTDNKRIPLKVSDELGLPLGAMHNLSVYGQTTTQIQNNAATLADPLIELLGTDTVYVAWEGSNECTLSSGSATAAKIEQLCEDKVVNTGISQGRIVVGTILPRTTEGYDAVRSAANVLIVSDYASYAGQLADVGNDATIGEDGDASNGTYYSDGTHFTAAGAAIVYPYFVDAIEAATA